MTNRNETQKTLTWTVDHNGPGTIRYYRATDEATGTRFEAHQFGKSKWALTATRNGEYVLDTTDRTLKGAKALAEGHLASSGTPVTPDASEAVSEAPSASEAGFSWASKKQWGSYGRTHSATATVDGVRYRAVVDCPQPGTWIFRGWIDGVFRGHETVRTACGGRDAAVAWLREKVAARREEAAAEAAPATVEVVEDVLASAAAVKVGDQTRTTAETLRGVSAALTDWARHATRVCDKLSRKATENGCGCPSLVHRMSCGRGARPAVINRKDA